MAGRPKLPDDAKKVKLSIAVSPEVEELARGSRNVSQFFEYLVLGYIRSRKAESFDQLQSAFAPVDALLEGESASPYAEELAELRAKKKAKKRR